MSEERAAAPPTGADETGGESENKVELQRRMEETRAQITETVAEIKGVVTQQYDEVRDRYESVREGIDEVLDWREQFAENPIVWGAGAVSVGILIGIGLSHAFGDADERRRGEGSHVSELGSHLIGEVAGLAQAVLPTLTGKVKEMFGVDLTAYLPGADEHRHERTRPAAKKEKRPTTTARNTSASKRRASGASKATHKRGPGKASSRKARG